MYEAFFGFDDRPFAAVPRTDRYFPGEVIELARHTLLRCVDRAEGCGLVVGATGTGKTLLCQVLVEHFRNRFAPVFLSSVRLTTPKELLQAVLFELGLPYRRQEEGELRLALLDRLTPGEGRPEGMLLIVDEAHALSPKLLEELRLLTNVIRGGSARVRLVLAGAPVLEERFATPQMASFNQRLTARCYLDNFSSSETQQFVLAQTAATGADPDRVWSADAVRTVHQITDGCPRLVNQLCDHTLLIAAAAESIPVTPLNVQQAWADLQQLPMPTDDTPELEVEISESGSQPDNTVIEFGELDDVVSEPHEIHEPSVDANALEISEALETLETLETLDKPETSDATWQSGESSDDSDDVVRPIVPTVEHAQPIEQIDRIVSQLETVEQSLEDSILPGPQVELDFAELADDDLDSIKMDTDATADESCTDSPEVVLDQFVGLDGHNVVYLAPSSQPITVDTTAHEAPLANAKSDVDLELDVVVNDPSHDVVHPEFEPTAQVAVAAPVAESCDVRPASAEAPVEPRQEPFGEHPAVPVRPREYRQLFSQLRRRGMEP